MEKFAQFYSTKKLSKTVFTPKLFKISKNASRKLVFDFENNKIKCGKSRMYG